MPTSGYKTATASYSWNQACAGSNRFLLVSVSLLSAVGGNVSSITYDSVALTFLGGLTVDGRRAELWGLVAPSVGTFSVAVTLSGAINSVGCSAAFENVNQITPTESFNSNGAS